MSLSVFSVDLHRIEVHAGPVDEHEREVVWTITADRGFDGVVILWGYLRAADGGGYGQAQVVAGGGGVADWMTATRNKNNRSELKAWVAEHAAETMYDTARRALQSQAAMMDFYFELNTKAPEADLRIMVDSPKKSTHRSKNS